jgi:hypothetical protein
MIEDLMFLFKALGDTLFILTLAAYMLYGMCWLASLTVPHHRARFDETWIEKTMKEVAVWHRTRNNKTVKR